MPGVSAGLVWSRTYVDLESRASEPHPCCTPPVVTFTATKHPEDYGVTSAHEGHKHQPPTPHHATHHSMACTPPPIPAPAVPPPLHANGPCAGLRGLMLAASPLQGRFGPCHHVTACKGQKHIAAAQRATRVATQQLQRALGPRHAEVGSCLPPSFEVRGSSR